LHADRHFAGHRALLLDGRSGRCDELTDLLNGAFDRIQRPDNVAGNAVQVFDLLADLVGRLLGLVGEVLDLGRNDGEAAAPAATDSIMPRTFSPGIRVSTWAVVSAAYFTTLYGLPLRSRIGF
jgi:hypothetical protein